MRTLIGELVVPLIVLVGSLLFWLHIQEARSVAQRVPNGVMIFILGALVIVVGRAVKAYLVARHADASDERISLTLAADFARNEWRRLVFLGLCIGYYLAFPRLGFDVANAGFLVAAFLLAGLRPVPSVAGALGGAVIFHLLARLMDFNVPSGLLPY